MKKKDPFGALNGKMLSVNNNVSLIKGGKKRTDNVHPNELRANNCKSTKFEPLDSDPNRYNEKYASSDYHFADY